MKSTKIAVIILSVAMLVATLVGISVSADNTPSVEIFSKNLSYGSNISIAFAVKSENIGDADVKLNVYEADPTANTALAPAATVTESYEETVHGVLCDVFFTPGINAKSIHRQVYVQAEVTVDGITYYSDVERYSVLEYCHEMIADEDNDAAKDAKFQAVINYGAAIQSLLADDGKFEGALATEYKYVTINGGTLDGKYNAGVYLAGTKLAPYAEGVGAWSDGNVAVLNGGEYTVTENATLNLANAKDMATVTFEGATSSNLPSSINCGSALPKIYGFDSNTYTNGKYEVRPYDPNPTNTLYLSSEYNKTKNVVKVGETATAATGANTVEFEADLMLKWSTSSTNCEFFNMAITDANGNVAFNIVLRNSTANNIAILLRGSTGGQVNDIGRTLKQNAVGVWFNLRVVYKYVSETEVGVEVFLDGTSVGSATTPYDASNAMSIDEIANGYFVVNGKPSSSHAINSYIAIDNIVFRKIAE